MPNAPRILTGALLALTLALGAAPPASAQLSVGVFAAKAVETAGGTWGAGASLRAGLVGLPVSIVGAVDYFRPDCPESDDCTFWGWSLDARLSIPLAVVSPYVTGGIVRRTSDLDDLLDARKERGLALGAGVELGALGAFVETRYEFVDSPSKQVVWRVGITL